MRDKFRSACYDFSARHVVQLNTTDILYGRAIRKLATTSNSLHSLPNSPDICRAKQRLLLGIYFPTGLFAPIVCVGKQFYELRYCRLRKQRR